MANLSAETFRPGNTLVPLSKGPSQGSPIRSTAVLTHSFVHLMVCTAQGSVFIRGRGQAIGDMSSPGPVLAPRPFLPPFLPCQDHGFRGPWLVCHPDAPRSPAQTSHPFLRHLNISPSC